MEAASSFTNLHESRKDHPAVYVYRFLELSTVRTRLCLLPFCEVRHESADASVDAALAYLPRYGIGVGRGNAKSDIIIELRSEAARCASKIKKAVALDRYRFSYF
jgi:hypothetical protein